VFVLFSHVINLQALKHIIILFVYVPVVVQANFIILVGLIQNS
jgi:biotin transporter BioY